MRWRVGLVLLFAIMLPGSARSDIPPWQPPITRAMVEQQFVAYQPDYRELKAQRLAQLRPLEERLYTLQANGDPMFCSAHMLNELRWLLQSSTQWSRIDKQIWLLKVSLEDRDQNFAMGQETHDGSWGVCYDEWFKKLDPMIQAINMMAGKNVPPEHTELEFLQPIDTPEELTDYLERIRISDIAETGLNRRDELGAVTSVMAEIIFKQEVQDYIARHVKGIDLNHQYAQSFRDFIDLWQDPDTGYWGPWYRIGGQTRKATDLSFTYHIIAYRQGDVRYWDKIVSSTLALEDHEYPFGWRYQGKLTNHNAYDVVRILQYGWPHMDEPQRREAAEAIQRMLDWSLGQTLQPDGTFVTPEGFDSSVSDAQYYGVSLLTKTGYCSTTKPFWSDRSWPEAHGTCCRIAARLDKLDADIPAAEAARRRLADAYPRCETGAGSGK